MWGYCERGRSGLEEWGSAAGVWERSGGRKRAAFAILPCKTLFARETSSSVTGRTNPPEHLFADEEPGFRDRTTQNREKGRNKKGKLRAPFREDAYSWEL